MLVNHFHLYPIYFNPNLTKSEGRKYGITFCKSITVHDLAQMLNRYKLIKNINNLDLKCQVENKNHPKSNNIKCTKSDYGRIRIDYKEENNKKDIIDFIKIFINEKRKDEVKQSKFVRIKKDKKSKKTLY